MKREWKPGDVALASYDGEVKTYLYGCEFNTDRFRWVGADGSISLDFHMAEWWRPIVVIDPEDREEVERFALLVWPKRLSGPLSERSMQMLTDAMHEFANPTPPKPEEPTGLGAVVEDVEGDLLTHIGNHDWVTPGGDSFIWSELKVIRVLSEGVAS